jgi:hypothetical protein
MVLAMGSRRIRGSGEREDRVGQRRRGGGHADLADPGRRLARFDQQHLDLRRRLHPHDRVGVEVLGDDLAAVAEDDLAPGGGAERVDEAAFDLSADQIGVDGTAEGSGTSARHCPIWPPRRNPANPAADAPRIENRRPATRHDVGKTVKRAEPKTETRRQTG